MKKKLYKAKIKRLKSDLVESRRETIAVLVELEKLKTNLSNINAISKT